MAATDIVGVVKINGPTFLNRKTERVVFKLTVTYDEENQIILVNDDLGF